MIKRLFRSFAVFGLVALTAGCASTKFTSTWMEPDYTGGAFKKIVVMGVSRDETKRRVFEDVFAARLKAAGVDAIPSYTLIPENGKVEKDRLVPVVRQAGADGVLITRLVNIDQKTQYSPGYATTVPAMGFYGNFYGYYSSAWAYSPPVAYQYEVVTVETNLWQVKGERLVWSGTTQTFAPENFRKEVDGFADLLAGALKEKGLI
jgi:hypothetical protein